MIIQAVGFIAITIVLIAFFIYGLKQKKKGSLFKGEFIMFFSLGIFFLLMYFLSTIYLIKEDNEEPVSGELHGLYKVLYVKDGDTFVVDIDGEEITIRLIGVDAPESVHTDETRNTEDGILVSDWLKELLTGEKVYLEYDVDLQDDYGRTLAYAYLEDGRMINKLLLENGYATVMTIEPNTKYAIEFQQLQAQTQKAGAGLWE